MEDSHEKSHQPTQKKLDDARKKGEIPRSQEVGVALTYLSMILVLFIFGATIMQETTATLSTFFSPALLEQINATQSSNHSVIKEKILSVLSRNAPFILGPLIVIVLMIAVQRSAIFVASNIAPKLDRISPIAGFKKKFGANGIFEFLKSFIKLVLFSAALTALILPLIDHISNLSRLGDRAGINFIFNKALMLLIATGMIASAIAAIDYVWQVSQFTKKNMMSFQELKDEHRDAEGDPHFKSLRRQRALDIATNRMIHDVPNADVVIVNPTHYAVALEWNPTKSNAPIVVAKGIDEIALKIKQVAESAGVPVHIDIPTARHLSTIAQIGDEVPVDFYQAVAAAIRFAQSVKYY
ncbi:flagellar type III secretion system protein FlhB [Loktanella sp. F6476L]|uniref:EscU/YscU/HrcU family type III secretion system export apparatus switch protein n=1 Tax=Loktanella sp. F6476L TaxID=2926405 RepID=UPI001FF52128|nr:flagellar type III secretion system protein FlhB [Loktanella sp. F6476L]MCK0120406.1 flagellar type III secretion system protein FlhB [Loktanella sp. F6476L]